MCKQSKATLSMQVPVIVCMPFQSGVIVAVLAFLNDPPFSTRSHSAQEV